MTAPAVPALTCNHAVDPLGVETPAPRLAWQLDPGRPGLRQTAWQVQAASTRERLEAGAPDLWDSGRVAGDRQFDVPYGGLPLGARRRAAWRVRAWDDQDAASAWSAPAAWEMGLLRSDDWVAQWIGADRGQPQKPDPEPAPLLRRACTLPGGAVRARAYVCGLGLGVFTVNGARPDDRVLAPAATTYDRAVLYETFDITPLLRDGENVFGLVLGNGWYNCHTREVWDFVSAPWRDQPKGLVQIHIEHADGGQTCIASGPDWRVHPGPVVFDGLRNGETFDARRALPGWDAPGFDDGAWTPAKVLRAPGGVLRSAQLPPMRVVETVAPAAETPRGPGVRVVDFGRNLTGWTRLTARGPTGAEVVLRHAEKRTPDGDIDQGNINSFIKSGETQTDRCLLAGAGEETAGEETWEPGFAYHGFQYVEVTAPETVDLRVEARVVHTDLPSRGGFRCSS
ncbi:MAG: family 78 glycoside hydrolase catalytic domain, partial [Planctomycetota bacterium]